MKLFLWYVWSHAFYVVFFFVPIKYTYFMHFKLSGQHQRGLVRVASGQFPLTTLPGFDPGRVRMECNPLGGPPLLRGATMPSGLVGCRAGYRGKPKKKKICLVNRKKFDK